MKTAEEIFQEKTKGKLISDLQTVMVEAMEEYANQFKTEPKQPELPKRWKDLKYIKGYYVSSTSCASFWDKEEDEELRDADKNIFATKEQAEAAIALAQLSQLREVYRQGWKPDWEDGTQKKYCIIFIENRILIHTSILSHYFISFQSAEIRNEFLKNFRELIEKAKPLMS